MSPLKIKMLLHYYAHARDYRDEVARAHAESEAVESAISDLYSDRLIDTNNADWRKQNPDTRLSEYSVTDKGRAMVEHLMAVQVPVCKWVQPISDLPPFPFTKSGDA